MEKPANYWLAAGEHTITIVIRKYGAGIDKLYIANDTLLPTRIGKTADILCMPDTATTVVGIVNLTPGSGIYS